MQALFIADVHIKLGQKNVPTSWQRHRFKLLADKINEVEKDLIIIGGDLLDVANPSIEEVGLLYDFLSEIKGKKVLIPGNHELINKTMDCYKYIDRMLLDLEVEVIRTFHTAYGIDFIPYNVIHSKTWPEPKSKLAVTHVRGEIPPHVEPEIDLSRYAKYKLVLAGDLHAKSNSQLNIKYPGSPMTTSFHRNKSVGENGAYLINTETLLHQFIDFSLPQLLRKSVTSESDMIKTDIDHTIYELEGSIEELSRVSKSDLLDKKVAKNVSTPATLTMNGSVSDELVEYLRIVKGIEDVVELITLLKEIVPEC